MSRTAVAVFDQTGKISQVTHCSIVDMHSQHQAWEDHDYVEVDPSVSPQTHRINTTTRQAELI